MAEAWRETVREQLAAHAHEQWCGWMQYLFTRCNTNPDGSVRIPARWVSRWQRQMRLSYADLRPDEQDSDREEAGRILACVDCAAALQSDAAAGRAETACATCGDESCDGETYHERHGRWGPRVRRRAFVEGATWWEYTKTGATMWPSDRTQAEQEAERRYAAPAPPAPPAPSPEAKARDG